MSVETATTPATMSLEEAVTSRRSVRGFLQKPVPQEIIQKIFELAQHAPSNCNIQPWRSYVASGASRDRIRAALVGAAKGGVMPNPDYDYPGKFAEPYRKHQVDCAVVLYTEMGIGREDKMGRMFAQLRNFELFDAPHAVFIGMDRSFREPVALDVGMYMQSLMLAMAAYGVASCAQGSLRYYPDLVRKEFEIPDTIGILAGISFGYEDTAVPANRTRIGRSPLGENAVFKD